MASDYWIQIGQELVRLLPSPATAPPGTLASDLAHLRRILNGVGSCSLEGCLRTRMPNGLCKMHYNQYRQRRLTLERIEVLRARGEKSLANRKLGMLKSIRTEGITNVQSEQIKTMVARIADEYWRVARECQLTYNDDLEGFLARAKQLSMSPYDRCIRDECDGRVIRGLYCVDHWRELPDGSE